MRLRKITFRRHIPEPYARMMIKFQQRYHGNWGEIECAWETKPRKKDDPVPLREGSTSRLYRLLRML